MGIVIFNKRKWLFLHQKAHSHVILICYFFINNSNSLPSHQKLQPWSFHYITSIYFQVNIHHHPCTWHTCKLPTRFFYIELKFLPTTPASLSHWQTFGVHSFFEGELCLQSWSLNKTCLIDSRIFKILYVLVFYLM